jgi:dTDP-4-dehydrorhamnose reductase
MGQSDSRILVLGATGMLGHVACGVLAERFDVSATARDTARAERLGLGVELHPFDAGRPEELPELLDRSRPGVVLNCIGIVKQLKAAAEAVPSIEINSLLPHRVAEACRPRGIRLIHVSTDCVFSGRLEPPGAYTEVDVPDPVDLYGRSKLLGELPHPDGLTLRTSIIGWELERASGLLEWLVSQAGRTIRGFANAWFSGLTTRTLSGLIADIVADEPELTGLYQVSSEPISKLDLVTRLNDILELGCEIESADEPRVNRVLDSTRFRERTGLAIPSWTTMLEEYKREGARAESR